MDGALSLSGAAGGGGAGVRVRNVTVTAGATGRQVNLQHLLGSTSTFSLLSGTNANIQLDNGDGLALTAGLAAGATQTAIVQETVGSGATFRQMAYALNCTGAPAKPSVPAVTLTPGNGQISVAWVDGSNGGATITAHNIYYDGVLIASPTGASPYVITGLPNGVVSGPIQVSAVNIAGEGELSSAQSAKPQSFVPPTFGLAKLVDDSRTANSGSRLAVGGTTLSVRHGMGGYTMFGLVQAACGNKWLYAEGYQHAVGATSTIGQRERNKQTYIGTNASSPIAGLISATANPAPGIVGSGAALNDALWSIGSDGLSTPLTQSGNHVLSASVGVNDGAGSYNTPAICYGTMRVIAGNADDYGAAGKMYITGTGFATGDTAFPMEANTPSGSGAWTVKNPTGFTDGESYGAVGVVGIIGGVPMIMQKVASAPGTGQYTVDNAGNYQAGGTFPSQTFTTYNATPTAITPFVRIPTSDSIRVLREWMLSSAPNFVSTINGYDYAIPGLRYNRPWVVVVDTFAASVDPSSGSLQLSKPGTMDNLQLHGVQNQSAITAPEFKAAIDALYPSAPSLDTRPIRNNYQIARGLGTQSTFTFRAPPSMRSAFTGGPVPTILSVNGSVVAFVDPSTGIISGPNVVSGSYNFSSGDGQVVFNSNAIMPNNAQLWLEQDIGNFTVASFMEGTIGRNTVMNGLLDMSTDVILPNVTTTTGTSSIGGVAAASIPFGWALSNSAMATAVSNGTATVVVGMDTAPSGFNRFIMEAYGIHTADTSLQLQQSYNSFTAKVTAGDRIISGVERQYMKTAINGRTYGQVGFGLKVTMNSAAFTRTVSAGQSSAFVGGDQQITEAAGSLFMDDQFVNLVESKGISSLYMVTPMLDTSGMTMTSPQTIANITTRANVPFAFRLGLGRFMTRRRNDFPAA